MQNSLNLYITLKSFNNRNINSYINFLSEKLIKTSQFKINILRLPKTIKKYTVLRSPHINKKAREQFEMRIYTTKLVLEFTPNNVMLLPLFVSKILKSIPPAINIKWQKAN